MKLSFFRVILFSVLTIVFVSTTYAVKIEFHDFESKQQEQLYLKLIAELRCVKCQNQNLAESNAELAKDMRDKAYELIKKGGTRADVIKYMTDRYGDFVLYDPPFKKNTLLLWIGPPVFLLLSLFLLFKLIRSKKQEDHDELSESDRESVRELLKSSSEK